MSSRLERKFAALRSRGEAAFVPFLTCGDPHPEQTLNLLRALERAGADAIEIGVPFSDPMADGPVIQRSSERALAHGTTLRTALDVAAAFRRESDLPLILFGYYNPVFRHGAERLAKDALAAGIDALLCVDLPPDESEELDRWLRAGGIDLIYLLAPTSTLERVRRVLSRARGFVYFVAVAGVTGVRATLPQNLETLVGSVRRLTRLPIGVGFGISTPEQAASVAGFADAVIVGSAIVRVIEEAPAGEAAARVEAFAASLKQGIRTAHAARKSA
jgi:tryptophan synthase alpha chain